MLITHGTFNWWHSLLLNEMSPVTQPISCAQPIIIVTPMSPAQSVYHGQSGLLSHDIAQGISDWIIHRPRRYTHRHDTGPFPYCHIDCSGAWLMSSSLIQLHTTISSTISPAPFRQWRHRFAVDTSSLSAAS